jgi:cell division protein DivIC
LHQNMNKKFWHKVLSLVFNKYFLSLVGFSIWIIFFDQHNLVDRYKSKQHLNQLRQDTVFYQQKILKDREAMKLLKTNPQNLERFARETYLMKTPDEEVFVILKKDKAK